VLALGKNAWVYILAVLLSTVLLYLRPRDEKRDWFITPISCGASLIVVRAFALLLGEQISAYNLLVICFEGFFAAGLSLIMLIALGILQEIEDVRSLSADELVCLFVLFLGCICGFGDLSVGGLAVRDVVSRFLVMLAGLWGGAGAGAGVGALMGILPSLDQSVSPALIGLYAFAGLLGGAFKGFARIGVAIGFVLGNVMLGLYIMDVAQIKAHLLATFVAVVLLFLLPEKLLKRGERMFIGVSLKSEEDENNRRRLRFSARRLQSTAMIFRDLALGCRTGGQQEQEQEKNVEMVLNHLCGQVCSRCSIRNLCWSVDVEETYRGVMGLFGVAEQKGYADVKDMPENFAKRCPHLRELVATINCLYELYCQNNYWQQQRAGSRLFLAGQLDGTADVMEKLASEMMDAGGDVNYIEKALARRFAKQGLRASGVQITHFGEKNLDFWVNLEDCPGEVFCRDMASKEVSRVLQKRFRTQEVSCGNNCGVGCCFHMLREGAGVLNVGKAQLAKDGSPVCGDSGDSVTLGEGRQLLMISDGMGVGIPAALKSGSAVNMLTHLLEVGFDRYTAVDTVNTVLMLQGGDEAFVTLDMCIIDRYDNSAEFIKTGAAPSFIKREGKVQVIKNASLPVGMLQTVDKAVFTAQLEAGDMVVMASDGLLDVDSDTDIEWLVNLLEDSNISDAQEMAEYLLGKAVSISGGRLKDDITVLVAQVA
jgi:stage II sporulation protein E